MNFVCALLYEDWFWEREEEKKNKEGEEVVVV